MGIAARMQWLLLRAGQAGSLFSSVLGFFYTCHSIGTDLADQGACPNRRIETREDHVWNSKAIGKRCYLMKLQTRCKLTFDIHAPTPFIFMLRPRSGTQQWVSSEEYLISPDIKPHEFTDNFGNLCQRMHVPCGNFSVHTKAIVIVPDSVAREPAGPFIEIQNLPTSTLCYLLPSRYCESEHFGQMAAEITTGLLAGYDQVAAIETWIRTCIRYELNGSDGPVSAREVNVRQWGVCRDLAHLGIALCRSLSIPARLVAGYLHGLSPVDMHAWFEAYVAGNWYTFDPTQVVLRGGYVALGYGRDAADVAIYNQFGPEVYLTSKRVMVECFEDAVNQSPCRQIDEY